ncbi:MAG: acyl-CoA dehydrogenase family protein [Actinomycetota bacterium]
MNFDLGPDELALRDGIRDLCTGRFPMERVRKGFDRVGWRELAEAGVFSLRLPDSEGGVGLGMTEAVIVFEELGRALVPGPLVATHLAAGLVDGAATGEKVVTLVELRADEGLPSLIEHGSDADAVLVFEGDRVAVSDGCPDGESIPSLDPLTPILSNPAGLAGSRSTDAHVEQLRREGAVLTAALSSGIASKLVDLAVAYANERQQFDRPIGSFQAVKHMCADMLVRAEVARSAVDAAGVLLDEDAPDAARAVSTAKILASEAAMANGKTCVQVHGGMGFTWEVDVHLYLKRAAVLATQFESADVHAEAMAALL